MSKKGKLTSSWNPSKLPYQTDYNDHFETPLEAYQDIAPLLNWIASKQQQSTKIISSNVDQSVGNKSMTFPVLYDPYYCNGRTKSLLRQLGFENVIHDKRDFYADIMDDNLPEYDIFVSNPPYSDKHKEKCLQFCFDHLRQGESYETSITHKRSQPFFLLMPNYVASKEYYRKLLVSLESQSSSEDVVYLVPNHGTQYQYEHPENTGKPKCPFQSLWFCGVGKDFVHEIKTFWQSLPEKANTKPTLLISLKELEKWNVVSFQNRPSLRQRRSMKKKQKQQQIVVDPIRATIEPQKEPIQRMDTIDKNDQETTKKRKSKYRDDSGQRIKRRF